jgi:hypothetical protein
MTTDRDFDRIARAWLETSPDEAPDRAVAAVLQAVDTTPQVRTPWRWLPWRSTPMNRIPIALGAAAVVVIAGTVVLSRSGPGPAAGSTPSPSPTIAASPGGSPASAGGSLPAELRRVWMGGHRGLVVTGAGSLLDFTGPIFHFAQSAGTSAQLLQSTASAVGDGKLRLESIAAADTCNKGDVGTYSWSLNPSGRILTVAEDQDACPTRAGAVVGTWWLMDCPLTDDFCLGALDSGTYASQFITPRLDPGAGATWSPVFGGLTYTVPDGWANAADWPESFDLVPVSELPPVDPGNRSRSILLNTQPSAMSQDKPCSDTVQPGVMRTVDAVVTWLGTVPGLVTTKPTAITIDGHPGQWLDIRMDPAWTKKCADGTGPIVTYMMPGTAVMGTERERLILLDLGGGDVVQILIFTKDQAGFDAFVPQAMPVIESLKFG